MKQRIVMRISEALERLKDSDSEFTKELKTYPSNYWVVEGDNPKEDGTPHLFILEDTEENGPWLLRHTPIDLKKYE